MFSDDTQKNNNRNHNHNINNYNQQQVNVNNNNDNMKKHTTSIYLIALLFVCPLFPLFGVDYCFFFGCVCCYIFA